MENSNGGLVVPDLEHIPEPGALLHLHPPYRREERGTYHYKAWPLYLAASEGDWDRARTIIDDDPTVVRAYITEGLETVLHVAALANKVDFVKNLVFWMLPKDLAIINQKGCTALCFAAVTGNVEIAQVMIKKNPELPRVCGRGGVLPIHMAAMLGHRSMVEFLWLYNHYSSEEEDIKLLIACITADLFDVSLKMIKNNERLAVAQDYSGETALGVLARKPLVFAGGSKKGKWGRFVNSFLSLEEAQDGNLQKTQYVELLTNILQLVFQQDHLEITNIIEHAPPLLFVAAELGNFEFLNLLIHYYPELVWKVNSCNQSIFHVAIKFRHESIFTLLHKMDAVRSLVTTYLDHKTNDNMLHLAAKLAPSDKLNIVSGAAFQMQQELLWYKEVEKIVPPSYRNMQNNDGRTPSDVFDLEHEELLEDGEKWMKATAKSCMVLAALIATVIFTAAFTVPGGNDKDGYPLLFKKVFFEIFDISETMALFSSSTSIIMFLSILTSRVTKHAFVHSLPCKLMVGVTTLFISIASMVAAFCTTMFLSYHHGSTWIPIVLLFSCVPIMFISLKFRLLVDIMHSTFVACFLFQPTKLTPITFHDDVNKARGSVCVCV